MGGPRGYGLGPLRDIELSIASLGFWVSGFGFRVLGLRAQGLGRGLFQGLRVERLGDE